MPWFIQFVMYLGIIDAVMLLGAGMVLALMFLFGASIDKFMERVFPALGILVGSHIAAVIVLAITRYITGT